MVAWSNGHTYHAFTETIEVIDQVEQPRRRKPRSAYAYNVTRKSNRARVMAAIWGRNPL